MLTHPPVLYDFCYDYCIVHIMSGGAAYCDGCYSATMLPRCSACSQPIADRALKAFGTEWHVACFVCEVSSSLTRQS